MKVNGGEAERRKGRERKKGRKDGRNKIIDGIDGKRRERDRRIGRTGKEREVGNVERMRRE